MFTVRGNSFFGIFSPYDSPVVTSTSFPLTQRSAVLGAHSDDPVVRERSWSALVSAYWKPAYKHVRIKWKANADDARDSIQGFFEKALEREFFSGYQPEVARFRTFFKTCLDRYVSNELKAATRQKRGGPAAGLAFDDAELELERAGAAAWESPDEAFEREWRRQLFTTALKILEERAKEQGKQAAWIAFQKYDLSEPPRPRYEELARELNVPTTTITNYLSWARGQLRSLVMEQLETITATEQELSVEAQAVGVA